ATRRGSRSTPSTVAPDSAKATASGSPTYPSPITPTIGDAARRSRTGLTTLRSSRPVVIVPRMRREPPASPDSLRRRSAPGNTAATGLPAPPAPLRATGARASRTSAGQEPGSDSERPYRYRARPVPWPARHDGDAELYTDDRRDGPARARSEASPARRR